MISLNSLRIFVAAYEEGSFTAAAQRENATQSGVSQHISHIEAELGVSLFERNKGGVIARPSAHTLYNRCLALLRMYSDAMEVARHFGQGIEGNVILGLMPTLTQSALAPTLQRYMVENPNVGMLVTEGYSGFLTEKVLSGQLDAAVVPNSQSISRLRKTPFASVPEVLVTSGKVRDDDWPNFGTLDLIMPSAGNSRRQVLENYCAATGLRIDRILELDSVAATLDLVSLGDWSAILPLPAVVEPARARSLTLRALPGLQLEMVIVSPTTSNLSPAVELFCAMLAEQVTKICQSAQEPE